MNKKRLLALLLTLAMVFSLAACSNSGQQSSATPAPQTQAPSQSTPAPAPEGGDQVEIVWWAFPTFGVDTGYEQELVEAFMAANSDVKVRLEIIDFQSGPDALTAAMGAGTAPDVLFDAPGRIIEYGNGGYLVPLDDMLDALKSDLTSESLVQTCTGADGTAWMYPISSSPFYMGLNKEALRPPTRSSM